MPPKRKRDDSSDEEKEEGNNRPRRRQRRLPPGPMPPGMAIPYNVWQGHPHPGAHPRNADRNTNVGRGLRRTIPPRLRRRTPPLDHGVRIANSRYLTKSGRISKVPGRFQDSSSSSEESKESAAAESAAESGYEGGVAEEASSSSEDMAESSQPLSAPSPVASAPAVAVSSEVDPVVSSAVGPAEEEEEKEEEEDCKPQAVKSGDVQEVNQEEEEEEEEEGDIEQAVGVAAMPNADAPEAAPSPVLSRVNREVLKMESDEERRWVGYIPGAFTIQGRDSWVPNASVMVWDNEEAFWTGWYETSEDEEDGEEDA